jgi:hypothetical protein
MHRSLDHRHHLGRSRLDGDDGTRREVVGTRFETVRTARIHSAIGNGRRPLTGPPRLPDRTGLRVSGSVGPHMIDPAIARAQHEASKGAPRPQRRPTLSAAVPARSQVTA